MIALLGALRQEIDGLLRLLAVEETIVRHGWRAFRGEYRGKEILLVQTGLGRSRSETATSFVLDRFPVAGVVSFGFGGALVGELKVGDVVLCSTIHCGGNLAGGAPCRSDIGLLASASRVLVESGARLILGSSVTVDSLVAEPKGKRELGMAFGAQTVDMEGYWVGRIAASRRLPFLAVRAVSDDLGQALPPFHRLFGPDGEWLWSRAATHFLSHPGCLYRLVRVGLNAGRAGKSLTRFLGTLIARL